MGLHSWLCRLLLLIQPTYSGSIVPAGCFWQLPLPLQFCFAPQQPAAGFKATEMRAMLGRFGLSGHHHLQPITKLSGGQKVRPCGGPGRGGAGQLRGPAGARGGRGVEEQLRASWKGRLPKGCAPPACQPLPTGRSPLRCGAHLPWQAVL